jgi:heme/copper-type cytochrome/quinol oxidase subunit 2
MKSKFKKGFLLTLGALLFSASEAASAFAQCAMCKASVQAGANASVNPQAFANTLNLAVLVLLIPPVLIFSALFVVLLRYRRNTNDGGALAGS